MARHHRGRRASNARQTRVPFNCSLRVAWAGGSWRWAGPAGRLGRRAGAGSVKDLPESRSTKH
eukprot:12158385-Alexandrium_andersonii.AAC.1